MTIVRWYLAEEAKRARIAHLRGHKRKGDAFSKCGKTIDAEVSEAVASGYYKPCRSCQIESSKEFANAEAAAKVQAPREGYPKTPELDKMVEIAKTKSPLLGEFLDWLDEKGLVICQESGDYFAPRRGSKEDLLADFFGVNLQKVDDERRAILEHLRKGGS